MVKARLPNQPKIVHILSQINLQTHKTTATNLPDQPTRVNVSACFPSAYSVVWFPHIITFSRPHQPWVGFYPVPWFSFLQPLLEPDLIPVPWLRFRNHTLSRIKSPCLGSVLHNHTLSRNWTPCLGFSNCFLFESSVFDSAVNEACWTSSFFIFPPRPHNYFSVTSAQTIFSPRPRNYFSATSTQLFFCHVRTNYFLATSV